MEGDGPDSPGFNRVPLPPPTDGLPLCILGWGRLPVFGGLAARNPDTQLVSTISAFTSRSPRRRRPSRSPTCPPSSPSPAGQRGRQGHRRLHVVTDLLMLPFRILGVVVTGDARSRKRATEIRQGLGPIVRPAIARRPGVVPSATRFRKA